MADKYLVRKITALIPGTDAVFEYNRKNNAEKKNRKMPEFKKLKKYDGIQQKNRSLGPVFIKREKSMKKVYQIIASCYLMILFYSRFVNRL